MKSDFLSYRGELGALMRAYDWESTPLGPPSGWPPLLKSTIRLILAARHPMFLWWGPDLIQFYNDAYRQTMGPERHPSSLGGFGRACWDEIWPVVGPQIESVMAGQGGTWHVDQMVPVTRHGKREDAYWTYGYSPVEDDDGVQGVLVICSDVTAQHMGKAELQRVNRALLEEIGQREIAQRHEAFQKNQRQQAEDALQSEREAESVRLRTLFQQAHGFMCILRGPTHIFEFANEAYLRLVGPRELIGKPVREALPDVASQGFYELLDSVYQSGQPYKAGDLAVALRTTPGVPAVQAHIDVVYQPIFGSQGVTGIFVQGYDVSDRKRAEESLREASRHKDEFLAMLSHELRNPLAPIRSAANLLGMAPNNTALVRKSSRIIERQVDHMTSLINDLLDVSRVNTGLVVLDQQLVDVRQVVSDAIEQTQPVIDAHRHRLNVQVPGEGEAMVRGDHKRLVQVLANLLHNAAKYTPDGGAIAVELSCLDAMVELHVRDNGIGIDAGLLPHVFELFTQEKRASDRAHGGLGLGLALVRSLVLLHGGRVAVSSQGEGAGTAFSVYLPRALAPVPDAAAKPAPAQTPGTLRLMVVDDNEDAANAMAMLLELAGHVVMVEHDPWRALERVEQFDPDACLLDIGLPGMDGNELARRLKDGGASTRAILIAVTGYGNRYDRESAIAAGFDHYLVKPANTEALLRILSTIDPLAITHSPETA